MREQELSMYNDWSSETPLINTFFCFKGWVVVDSYEQQPGQKNHNKKAMGKQKMGVNKKYDCNDTRMNAEKNLFTQREAFT